MKTKYKAQKVQRVKAPSTKLLKIKVQWQTQSQGIIKTAHRDPQATVVPGKIRRAQPRPGGIGSEGEADRQAGWVIDAWLLRASQRLASGGLA